MTISWDEAKRRAEDTRMAAGHPVRTDADRAAGQRRLDDESPRHTTMDGRDVDQAVAEMLRVLTPHTGRDWRVPAGSLDWTCWTTAAHVAHDLMAYAGQLAAAADSSYLPFDLVVHPDTAPQDVLRVVATAGRLLISAISVADPTLRAWHWGPTDPGGFAALGVNETLMHTHDITRGLAIDWRPPAALCAAVLARLFPDAPSGDPVSTLLWATGRGDLAGRPRLTSWVLRAALD
jgi:Mycothiol maleylpyruvate isomerase N-terminal domain